MVDAGGNTFASFHSAVMIIQIYCIMVLIHLSLGVLVYHTEDLLGREDCILSTRFDRMDPTECFFIAWCQDMYMTHIVTE